MVSATVKKEIKCFNYMAALLDQNKISLKARN